MQIQVLSPEQQTLFFGIIFVLTFLFSIRKIQSTFTLSKNITDELKGFAILAVVFSHIGYFLSTDPKFLFPFSIAAGVGVNTFLFLSGFGLTSSALKDHSVLSFYQKRLLKIYLPMWIVISSLLLLDLIVLKRSYAFETITQNFLGWFPNADIFTDLNSPLWYFSLILFYYLVFPLLFWKKAPFLTPLLIFLAGSLAIQFIPIANQDVKKLYLLHNLAFPLGISLAIILNKWGKKIEGIKLNNLVQLIILIPLVFIFAYTAYHSGVGKSLRLEQGISLVTMFSVVLIFVLKNMQFRFLYLFGIYSYEIYLFHWPLMSRFDFLYKFLPPFLATVLYLITFLLLGFLLQKLVGMISTLSFKPAPKQELQS